MNRNVLGFFKSVFCMFFFLLYFFFFFKGVINIFVSLVYKEKKRKCVYNIFLLVYILIHTYKHTDIKYTFSYILRTRAHAHTHTHTHTHMVWLINIT